MVNFFHLYRLNGSLRPTTISDDQQISDGQISDGQNPATGVAADAPAFQDGPQPATEIDSTECHEAAGRRAIAAAAEAGDAG